MNRIKRSKILKILKSGWSAVTISYEIGLLLNQPEEDILRIINANHWKHKPIMGYLELFQESNTNLRYLKFGTEMIVNES